MSDWEDDSDGDTNVASPLKFDDEEEDGFSDEEDETLAELAREKKDAEAKVKAGKPKKTFDEIMAERKIKDAQKIKDDAKKEELEKTLSPEEQLSRMRTAQKEAEEADNRLMNELLGVEMVGDGMKVEEDPEALEILTLAVSQLTLAKSADISALASALISQLRAGDDAVPAQLGGFLETLLSEIITVQMEGEIDSIGNAINAAKTTAEALNAANVQVSKMEETKKTKGSGKTTGGKNGKGNNGAGRGDKLVGMFDSMGLGGDDEEEEEEEDSDESDEEEEEDDFM